jgi:hypothetical protein
MGPWDEGVFDDMCALLPPKEAADARDYLDHNEFELAFETAVDYLAQKCVPISATLCGRIAEAAACSRRVLGSLPYCPDADEPRWRNVEDTWEGLEIEERLPGSGAAALLACNRCPEVLFVFDWPAVAKGKAPYRTGILLADGEIEELAEAQGGLDRLQRCWS